MNLNDAYATLELQNTATPEEAAKQFKKLARTWHPDVNKAPEAEATFKKINEAYECVKNGKGNEREYMDFNNESPFNPFAGSPFGNPFGNPFQQQRRIDATNIEIDVSISFKESALGCKQEVKYTRNIKCNECKGTGAINVNNGCDKCGGQGRFVSQQHGMTIMNICNKCHGRNNSVNCPACKGKCAEPSDISSVIALPAGIVDGNILRIQGKGNFAGAGIMGMESYTDVFCHIRVAQEEGLKIEGDNVVSSLDISLLEALQGTKKTVKTIFGDKEISIPDQSRHKDEVLIPNCGVNGTNDQRVILNVSYPQKLDEVIQALIHVKE